MLLINITHTFLGYNYIYSYAFDFYKRKISPGTGSSDTVQYLHI